MLKELSITNLAIISNIDITFDDGFTVLTGETGAGKSLVIDSLSLLLGERASTELIRKGEEKAIIKGIFELHSPEIEGFLTKKGIPALEELTIERIIGRSKSSARINGTGVSLSDLQAMSKFVADIHSQFDFQKILNPENYLSMLDGFSRSIGKTALENYQNSLHKYLEIKAEYNKLIGEKAKLEESKDFYSFQYKELKDSSLYPGEEAEIESQIDLLKNYDKIYSLTQEANEILHEDFFDRLYDLDTILKKLSNYQKQYQEAQQKIDDRYFELNDIFDDLKKQFADLDYDPEKLNELEQRQSDISELKRKYKKNYEELIEYRDYLSHSFGDNSNLDAEISKKEKELDNAFEETFTLGNDLHKIRETTAKRIEKELQTSLDDLLLKANFKIEFAPISGSESSFRDDGLDNVDFLMETNVGEGLKSLSKVISGGEASRIMLAIKAIFIKANQIPTVVFDEIDTGISGVSAEAVAKKIREISLSAQVISITHMPQVAAKSDHHVLIEKKVEGGRTFASIRKLALEEKINQVAYLISGGTITKKQLDYASEMVLCSK